MTNKTKTIFPKVSRLKFLSRIFTLLRDPIEVFSGFFKQHGNTFQLSKSDINMYFTQNAQIAEHVFLKNNRNYWKPDQQKDLLGEYLGKGLLTSDGDYWLQQRRLIQPGFKKQNLAHFTNLMQAEIDQFDDRLLDLLLAMKFLILVMK